jgi:hypothetical protein
MIGLLFFPRVFGELAARGGSWGGFPPASTKKISGFAGNAGFKSPPAAQCATRINFNQNLTSAWFNSVLQIINDVTMLAELNALVQPE